MTVKELMTTVKLTPAQTAMMMRLAEGPEALPHEPVKAAGWRRVLEALRRHNFAEFVYSTNNGLRGKLTSAGRDWLWAHGGA